MTKTLVLAKRSAPTQQLSPRRRTSAAEPVPPTASLRGHTVVVVHAHPDDEAIFTGVTLRRLADRGARVVLVTATLGDLGEVRIPLRPGESLARRRMAELERAAELLGVARVVTLGLRDSGLPGSLENLHPRALMAADPHTLGRQLAILVERESASALLHDDPTGIYGHPDHRATHQIGARAARLTGVPAFQVTVDRDHLHEDRPHLVQAAARATACAYGVPGDDVHIRVAATEAELEAKRAAIAAHASQIDADTIGGAAFNLAYGLEWYVRTAGPGVLDLVGLA